MKKNIITELIIIFWLFIIGSLAGYVFEMIVVFFQKGFFETRQGLIYGPFIPVYGIGAVVYYLILNNINTKNKIKIFFITMILGGLTEYICSFMQEKIFGTISWDYSHLLFDINGRTSLLHCTYWGIAGVLYISYIVPVLEKIRNKVNNNSLRVVTGVAIVIIFFDISISCMASLRQLERREGITPDNNFDILLDKYYPDEFMDSIFTNKKNIM